VETIVLHDAEGTWGSAARQARSEQPRDVVQVRPTALLGRALAADGPDALRPLRLTRVDPAFPAASEALIAEARPPNVLVLKSLSKCLGVPGLRLGYLHGYDRDFLATVRARLPIWNLNSVAEYLLELLLKHRASYAASVAATVADREAFAARLAGHPLVRRVWPSGANFLLVDLTIPPDRVGALRAALLADRVWVKDATGRFADGIARLRVAVGRPDENDVFLAGLARWHQAAG
jgi:histidinol-phosphate/aromatic aminotransferase/cobyric acid decarboxylase-like protein